MPKMTKCMLVAGALMFGASVMAQAAENKPVEEKKEAEKKVEAATVYTVNVSGMT
ncbi:MAG: hypothetical protein L6Q71_09445 [Planctomycetes bacterium]|nr:hypothetical protein [Planctomycetota bacterium]NUQ34766.1 hypothetical protein [Planctomycetaceae bacterium]